ncbi:unnamed protein product [Porites evermanni]|uniref:Uncharacterized protein n=1 Tax=Porites evermanni TaxID=104178 RepID=A0ABN8LB57_9CNID|nr:unnamed protein product [Porites evermanni]
MNLWRTGIIVVILIGTVCSSHVASSSDLSLKQKIRSRRMISEDIKTCKHWNYETTDDPHFADVHVNLHNAASTTKKMSVALQCTTMNKILEPKSAFSIPSGKKRDFAFRIAVASKFHHRDSSVRQHKCQLSTWNEDEFSLVTCKFNISVWPNGMFYYKCSKYQKDQLSVSQSITTSAKQIKLYNKEERSVFLINSTCKPVILSLQLVDMYKNLEKGQEWSLEFPLSCSGATSLNYYGKCSVKIYHTCREVTTHVKTVMFEFMDGEIPECEYVKSLLGKIARNSFAASLGVNDDWSAALSLAAMVEVLLIIGTLFVKFVYVGLTKGWNSSKKEFSDRVFNALSLKRTSSQAKDKSEKDVTEANDGAYLLEENRN